MTEEALKKLVTSRQSKLETNRGQVEDIWTSVAEFVNIGLGSITNYTGTDKTFGDLGKKAFDGTAIGAAVLATSGIHGYHVSPSFPWFNYVMSREVLNKVPEIKEWLDEQIRRAFNVILEHEHSLIAVAVRDVLAGFDKNRFNQFLESKVGEDLAWIRINGAIVGASIGLCVFGVLKIYQFTLVPFLRGLFL